MIIQCEDPFSRWLRIRNLRVDLIINWFFWIFLILIRLTELLDTHIRETWLINWLGRWRWDANTFIAHLWKFLDYAWNFRWNIWSENESPSGNFGNTRSRVFPLLNRTGFSTNRWQSSTSLLMRRMIDFARCSITLEHWNRKIFLYRSDSVREHGKRGESDDFRGSIHFLARALAVGTVGSVTFQSNLQELLLITFSSRNFSLGLSN